MTPSPRKLPSALGYDEVNHHRKTGCVHYKMCLDLADTRDWPSFSCANCDGLTELCDGLAELAGTVPTFPKDAPVRLVLAIIEQAWLDIKAYHRTTYSRAYEVNRAAKNYRAAMAFFFNPYKAETGEMYRSYCHHLLTTIGLTMDFRIRRILRLIKSTENQGRVTA